MRALQSSQSATMRKKTVSISLRAEHTGGWSQFNHSSPTFSRRCRRNRYFKHTAESDIRSGGEAQGGAEVFWLSAGGP